MTFTLSLPLFNFKLFDLSTYAKSTIFLTRISGWSTRIILQTSAIFLNEFLKKTDTYLIYWKISHLIPQKLNSDEQSRQIKLLSSVTITYHWCYRSFDIKQFASDSGHFVDQQSCKPKAAVQESQKNSKETMRLQPELQKILVWTNSFLDLIFGIQLDRLD